MKILFQGDSITDCGRVKEDHKSLGNGYASFVCAHLGFEVPEKYEFINRGISGNRIVDIYARIKKDIINLAPDVMSILIGVNDVWHDAAADPNGVDAEKFEKIYSMLLEEIIRALPNIKIMIMEPFVLSGPATQNQWDYFDSEVKKRAEIAKKLAAAYNLTFVPLQAGFDALEKSAKATYWLKDGVHPTGMGHEFIKRQWVAGFETL